MNETTTKATTDQHQVPAIVTQCLCSTWARGDHTGLLMLSHHPSCGNYKPEKEVRELLLSLIAGIEAWAADEDGVHPDCWEPYMMACGVVGKTDQ